MNASRATRSRRFGDHAHLADPSAFAVFLKPLRKTKWFVYAKRPFAGPEAVLAYLSRYTHRVAISNSRLIDFDDEQVTFRWKDYRAKTEHRYQTMQLDTHEFIRRFLLHVLPSGFHRIRHFGLFANGQRKANLTKARALLHAPPPPCASDDDDDRGVGDNTPAPWRLCPQCGHTMTVVEFFDAPPRHRGRDPPW